MGQILRRCSLVGGRDLFSSNGQFPVDFFRIVNPKPKAAALAGFPALAGKKRPVKKLAQMPA